MPEGGEGTFYGPYRGTINGKLTGAGQFKVYSGGVRCYWNGDWSAFEGTLIPALINRQAKPSYDPSFDWNNDFGLAKATLQVDENVTFNYGVHPLPLGNAKGKGVINGTGVIVLGARNEDINFGGTFKGMEVQKVGTGVWTINASQKQLSLTRIVVNGGTLYLYSLTNATAIIASQATIAVNDGGTLMGTALVPHNCNVFSGGTVTIGMRNSESRSGELKFLRSLNVRQGATVNMNIKSNENSTYSRTFLTVGATLTLNGTVNVTLDPAYQPAVGDEIVLWTATSFSGTPTLNLPELPEGLFWDTSLLLTKEGKLRVSGTEGIGLLPSNMHVACTVYTMGGQQVTEYEAKVSDVVRKAHKQHLPAGAYIIRMQANGMKTSQKVIIR